MMTEGSTQPFPGKLPQGVDVRCDNGHTQRFYLRGMTVEMARDYCQILDGTSPIYVRSPRDDSNTSIGHCKDCGALFRATPFGFE